MNLSTLQQERNEWVEHNFPRENDDTIDSILGAVEEVGELAHHYLKRKQNIRGEQDHHTAEMLDAVADCVIFLAGVCTHLGVDYGELVQATWNTVKTRDWIKYPTDGRSH